MRQIGNNTWLKPGVDFEKGDTIFEKARYLGDEEGSFGIYQVFQDLNSSECYNLGGGHLNWLCTQIEEGDVVRLDYEGEETLQKGKFKGKKTHRFGMFIHEEDEDNGPSTPAPKKSKPKKKEEVKEVDVEDEEDEEEVTPKAAKKKAPKKKIRGRPKAKVEIVEVEDDESEDDLEDLE